jgi:extradiol dioxygenase family protein
LVVVSTSRRRGAPTIDDGAARTPVAIAGLVTLESEQVIGERMKVLFIAGFGPIATDIDDSRRLYGDALGITFKVEEGDYLHTERVEGAKTFAVWPLAQAAESCFGTNLWPTDVAVPQAWLEFDVDDIEAATRELQERGLDLLVQNRIEPWGQVVTRLLSPEGLLVGVTVTLGMRGEKPKR